MSHATVKNVGQAVNHDARLARIDQKRCFDDSPKRRHSAQPIEVLVWILGLATTEPKRRNHGTREPQP